MIQYLAAKALTDYIAQFLNDIPGLAIQQPWEISADYPNIVVLPGKHKTWLKQESIVDDTPEDKALVYVGDLEGIMTIKINSLKAIERSKIEEKVITAFFQQPLSRRQILVQLPAINYGGAEWNSKAIAGFSLVDEQWNEEKVFTASRFSTLTVKSLIQLYVSRDYNTIDTLKLVFQIDGIENEVDLT